MSAILNALKKLEEESSTLRPWSMRIRNAGTAKRGKKIFLLLALLPPLGAALFAGYFHFKIPRLFTRRPAAVFEAGQALVRSPLGADSPEAGISAPPAPVSQPAGSLREAHLTKSAHPIEAPARKAAAAPGIIPAQKIVPKPRSGQNPVQPTVPPAQPATAGKTEPLGPVPLSSSEAPAVRLEPVLEKTPEEPVLPVFNDPTVQLQAIAWSDDPGQRIAVVNGQVLREGDSVAGVTITKIRKDEVFLRDGEQTLKIVFQGR